MKKRFCLALLAMFLAYLPVSLWAQDESPLIVDQPRFSKTAFFNWDLIEVVFTVRYLDGYEPVYDRMNPESMSFQPFEPDSVIGAKLKIVRRQKYKEENYLDAVYYLRLVGEKKGDIILPAQKFFYVKLEPGKPREELEVKEFETKEVKLSYHSVLTSKADDIIDRIDFGDFSRQAFWWKAVSATGLALSLAVGWFFIFRRRPEKKNRKKAMEESLSVSTALAEKISLTPKQARKKLAKTLFELRRSAKNEDLKQNYKERHRLEAAVCNALREFLLTCAPGLSASDTPKEIYHKISGLKPGFQQHFYLDLAYQLFLFEDFLFQDKPFLFSGQALIGIIGSDGEKKTLRRLNRPWIWWHELRYKFSHWRLK